MSTVRFDPRPMTQLGTNRPADAARWVWDGLLARGDLALLTGVWKTGKTTLLAGLLHALEGGGAFLGRPCAAGAAVVVSEEEPDLWDDRRKHIPIGPHVRLVSRPFLGRPSPAEWDELIGRVEDLRAAGPLDLFVVDPLAEFVPGRCEFEAGTVHDFLRPLRRLAAGGTAVLVLHHPRRQRSEEGSLARGGGLLLGAADALLELHHVGRGRDGTRRRLAVRSRRPGAVPGVVYEWVPGGAEFRVVPDDPESRFRENWDAVRALLAARPAPATQKDLLADWPLDEHPPSASLLYDWLRRAAASGLAARSGSGTRYDPFRFALPRQADGLPELGPLPGW